jgi:nucleoside phosphorylase
MSGLLILAPMSIEEAMLRNRGRVLRTGMGPDRARIAAARALAIDADAVVVAGLCGGVSGELHPGDVVCATELRREDGVTVDVPGAESLAAVLRRHGFHPHLGALLSTDHVLTPAERARLGGVLAVDMESAWLADAAGGRPFAVLRVVVDAAGRRLVDPRIVADGLRALRSLRRCGAVLSDWAQATPAQSLYDAEVLVEVPA